MTSFASAVPTVQTGSHPSFREASKVWLKIGCLSFGGPAGQIALMHRVLVDERGWLDERRFLSALNFCMLLPGPEAMQLATYAGWRLHGVAGGLAAGLLFVIPGALVVLVLSAAYALFGSVPIATALLTGVKAAVLAIVVEALLRVAKRALKSTADLWTAAAAFLALFFLGVPFPLIVIAAALSGLLRSWMAPHVETKGIAPVVSVPWRTTARSVLVWLVIWIAPLALLSWAAGPDHVLSHISWFFSKLAVVTFGGAYAVLSYMAQEAVQGFGWLKPAEMVDGLGLAETTPGPLILVTQFVGFLAAFRSVEGGSIAMGLAGAGVTLWSTFAPCFLWVFAGAPYIESLEASPRLSKMLASVTAAVVGVILNLSVWFALHVLFSEVSERRYGVLQAYVPNLASIDWVALGLAILASALLFWGHAGVLRTLGVTAMASAVISWAL